MEIAKSRDSSWRTFAWLAVFAAAMGLLEAIVVVYLRELYHPAGFQFPMTPVPQKALFMEIAREICTLVMLGAVSAAVARNAVLRISVFLFTFGVWDIFYYLSLKFLLDWPQSLLTWDVLFLIPIAWTAPVLAPVLVALTMIGIGILLVRLQKRFDKIRTGSLAWGLLALGLCLIFATFIWDYSKIIIQGGFLSDMTRLLENPTFQAATSTYVPRYYNWPLFVFGEGLVLAGIMVIYKKTLAQNCHKDTKARRKT